MNILYISISGNTRSFVHALKDYAMWNKEDIHLKEIDDLTVPEVENGPFFVFLPTYLEGGNGIDNGDKEIMTESMREYLEYGDNASKCLGIIGSGNKNFNAQCCLTAKQYSEQFNIPVIDDYELRGTPSDIERIYNRMKERL